MSYEITLTEWQFIGILLVIFLAFIFCMFFDFFHKCKNCKSRWREIIDRVELCKNGFGDYVLFRMKIRRCFRCGDRMLLKKKYPKKYEKKEGKDLIIRL
jgi:hypothetical protein